MTNLVLFMADQLRADGLSCYGNGAARTPALDRLARRGMRLDAHFTSNQICAPSRATLFSGTYARRHGVVRNGIALADEVELLSHAFRKAGHRTHGVGKFHFQPILAAAEYRMPDSNAFWRLKEAASWHGPFFGFETADIVIGESAAVTEGGHYAAWLRAVAPDLVEKYRREHALAPPPADLDEVWKCAVPEPHHYNSWIADRAIGFLHSLERGEPFFLFVSFPDPHHPFTPPAPWCDRFDPGEVPMPSVVPGELDRMPAYIRDAALKEGSGGDTGKSYLDFLLSPGIPREQGFLTSTAGLSEATLRLLIAHTYGAIAMLDAKIGAILAALESLGRADETVIVFTSDHGELLGDHGLLRKGPPPYRQLLQVPFIVAGPGVRSGSADALTSHVDVKATLLELSAIAGESGDGASFAPLLRGEAAPGREMVLAEYHPRAVADQYNQTLIAGRWRYTAYLRRPDWGELFDRWRDPDEHCNLFHEPSAQLIVGEMQRQMARFWPPNESAGSKSIATY
jgi:arylsulfatase A-like enzyme